jgi:lipoprotein-releasing system permease protein
MFKPLELFIGLRYTRAKRRNHFISFISFFSIFGIFLGVLALITVLSVMNGFHKEIRERILGMASHATISALSGGLSDWREVMDLSKGHPRVVGQAPFVEVQGMLVNGQNVSGALVRGVNPQLEGAVSDVGRHMRVGNLEQLQQGEYQMILGRELALILDARVGDKVTLVTPSLTITPMGNMPRLKSFTVSGIFEVGMGDYDRGVALVQIDDAARLLRLGEAVTGVRLKLDDMDLAPKVSHELAKRSGGIYRVSDWTQQHRNFFSALHTEKRMMSLILFIIVLVAAFNIVSTLVMVVTDKQADIAILRTLGASPRSIMGIFIVQGATLGIVGNVLGIIAGIVLSLNLEAIVKGVEGLMGVDFLDPNIYYISELPSDMHWSDVGVVSLVAFVITLAATLYPAFRAARVQPAEALRYE